MISYLKGEVIKKGINCIVLNINNVGYKVFVNESFLADLEKGNEIETYTHQHVREDSLDLYGFASEAQLDFFELLISISGIGPKSGLAALAIASVDDLKNTIAQADPSLLTKVSGIGKKTAERVVLELKDKVGTLVSENGSFSAVVGSDEIDALMALGYSMQQAREALAGIDKDITDSGEKIKQALKSIKR